MPRRPPLLPVALALLAACSQAEAPPAEPAPNGPPSMLLVTFDTTRADRIGCYGYEAAGTPTLDRLAAEGVRFDSARASVPVTLPSHTTILTGVMPPVHGVRDNGIFVLGPGATLVSEVLKRHGWQTGAFVGSYVLDPRFGLDQGFDTYRAPPPSASSRTSNVERPASEVVDDAVAWLSSLDPARPFFAWLHFYDPHGPHAAPEPWQREHADPYDAEVAFCDAQLARLLHFLESRGLARNLLVAVTADHGESFGEHGEETHGAFVYDATLHVPLILSGAPVAQRAGEVVETRVSTAALAPTLLELAGIPRAEMGAASLPPLLPPPTDEPPLYIESYYPYHSFRWHAFRGLVWEGHKLILGKRPELYDLSADPHELHDLAEADPPRLARMRDKLGELLETEKPLGWAGETTLDATEQAALEALGYLEAQAGGDPFDPSLPDPHDRIGDVQQLERASELDAEAQDLLQRKPPTAFQRGEVEQRARALRVQARDLLAAVIEHNPDDPISLHRLGNAELALGHYAEAARILEEVVRLRPASSVAHYNLGVAYRGLERDAEALRELEQAVALEPGQPRYHLQLAFYHQQKGDWKRSAEQLEQLRAQLAADDPLRPGVDALWARVEQEREREEN